MANGFAAYLCQEECRWGVFFAKMQLEICIFRKNVASLQAFNCNLINMALIIPPHYKQKLLPETTEIATNQSKRASRRNLRRLSIYGV